MVVAARACVAERVKVKQVAATQATTTRPATERAGTWSVKRVAARVPERPRLDKGLVNRWSYFLIVAR